MRPTPLPKVHLLLLAVIGCVAVAGCAGSARHSVHGAGPADSSSASPQMSRSGSIEGALTMVGGPAMLPARAVSQGSISITGQTTVHVSVDRFGRFSATVPPGRYQVTGHSPAYGSGAYTCRAARVAVVRPDRTRHVDVVCQVR